MAIDAVAVGTRGTGSGTLTTGGGSTTTGSTFVICQSFDAGASRTTALSALDNKGNTYIQAGTTLSASGHKKEIYYCANGTGGASHAASCAFSGSSFGAIYLIEIPGAATSSFDVTNQGVDSDGTPYTIATGVLSQAAEVVIALCGNGDGDNPMNYASSNMTVLDQEGNGGSFWTSVIAKQVVAATTSFVCSFTSAQAASNHSLITATFKEAAGGGATLMGAQCL